MLKPLLALFFASIFPTPVAAQTSRGFDDSAQNLMVVLRESQGSNKQVESLVPMGKAKAKLQDGREIEIDTGWFEYLGDMHVRFVFDTPTSMPSATPKDIERLALTPEAALELAVRNIKRVYGEPKAVPLNDLFEVKAKSPDLDSSYFLDKDFWNAQLKKYPDGVVALVAKRGGLMFAPLVDLKAVETMKSSVAYLHSSSERMRISSALYLFKDGKWSVYQAPVGARTQ
ncbi:hypothetical protein [Undibacterium curvum]|jgi:hypothetical protein|uniref:DUF2092 domain-containing protein n=1 Tax=Undibacterium curvum TaxID=2762294 RepID=A0ABR7A173_9BURK|nr:hypothetical protein [Undibacterium curvum]MBC3930432.1 hypothetical protein [Undibacterium curvum]